MARTAARLTEGSRITDYISLGVVAKAFPKPLIDDVLKRTGRTSARERDLPAHVVVYYVIALALYMQASYREVLRCLMEGAQWLADAEVNFNVASKSSISQARTRLGWEAVRLLHDEVVRPIATEATPGAFFRRWRLVSIDGSCLDVPDEQANHEAFGKQETPRGECAFPQIRFVSLVENGTHVLFGSRMSPYGISEGALAEEVLPQLKPGMLCLADRGFYSFPLWTLAQGTGADLLWRLRTDLILPREQELADGSFLSTFFESAKHRKEKRNGILIRVVEYTLEGTKDAEPLYRLATTILDPAMAEAKELAALYHERWEIESAFDERAVSSRSRRNPRAIKRKMSNWPVRKRGLEGTGKVTLQIGILLTPHPMAKRKPRTKKARQKEAVGPTPVDPGSLPTTRSWTARGADPTWCTTKE